MNANDACKHLIEKIQSALNLHAPEKVIIIPAKNIINEKWMTKGLLNDIFRALLTMSVYTTAQ